MAPSNKSNKRGSGSELSAPNHNASVEDGAAPRSVGSGAEEKEPYESPLKRVHRAIAREANKRVIDNAEELKAFILKESTSERGVPPAVAASIAVRMRVVWTSYETYDTGPVARIHLIDQRVDDDVGVMHELLKDGHSVKRSIVDSELVTASLYGADENTPGWGYSDRFANVVAEAVRTPILPVVDERRLHQGRGAVKSGW